MQAVQHYAIARYGTLLAWAVSAGQEQAVNLLRQLLDGAKQADEALNQLAARGVNQAASKQA